MSEQTVPITENEFVQAISELPDDALLTVRKELEVSIGKLLETNQFLQDELPAATPDDKAIYEEALLENVPVIKSKKVRLNILKDEFKTRGIVWS